MTSTALEFNVSDLGPSLERLIEAANPDMPELLENVGAIIESQTKYRISDEKTSPSGEPWADWSEDYAKTRTSAHSLLEGEGFLYDSIAHEVLGDDVQIGSGMIYAAIQQFGGADVGKPGLASREYLGLSEANKSEVLEFVEDYLAGRLEDA
ncbi:phage virion morphogenesis protein [Kiloniella litopenaei]|uniref:phage virion morphogenesis protein n=1 Tax=Kiloniella litopenaei TaxID=1549748 RepID=UPI003BAA5289